MSHPMLLRMWFAYVVEFLLNYAVPLILTFKYPMGVISQSLPLRNSFQFSILDLPEK